MSDKPTTAAEWAAAGLANLPAGFARTPSGLIVSGGEDYRQRETWTRADWKTYEKAVRVLAAHELMQQLRCKKCAQALKAEKVDATTAHLTCGCTIRVFTKAF